MITASDIQRAKPDYSDPLYYFKMVELMRQLRESVDRQQQRVLRLYKS